MPVVGPVVGLVVGSRIVGSAAEGITVAVIGSGHAVAARVGLGGAADQQEGGQWDQEALFHVWESSGYTACLLRCRFATERWVNRPTLGR